MIWPYFFNIHILMYEVNCQIVPDYLVNTLQRNYYLRHYCHPTKFRLRLPEIQYAEILQKLQRLLKFVVVI